LEYPDVYMIRGIKRKVSYGNNRNLFIISKLTVVTSAKRDNGRIPRKLLLKYHWTILEICEEYWLEI
jgi:hypothetical protein